MLTAGAMMRFKVLMRVFARIKLRGKVVEPNFERERVKRLRHRVFVPMRKWVLFGVAALGCSVVIAADFSLTGFGTAGYAVSDQNFKYLRYIDSGGTLKADSLIGLQGELRVDPQWSATAQVVASAPRTRDNGYETQIRWAFASYRPNNEWLFRVGRLRPPVLINTQNAEVGVTYDQARLPVEVYSLSPVYDVDGGAFTKTWTQEDSEINLDGYLGKSSVKQRTPFQRDATQTFVPSRFPEKIRFMGLVLTRNAGPLLLRAGYHHAMLSADRGQQFVDDPSPVLFPAPPPYGGTIYIPGAVTRTIGVSAVTVGAEWRSGDWRISSEYGRRTVKGTKMGPASNSAHITVARDTGKWTPYVSYARLLSAPVTRKYYQDLNATAVPVGAQGPPLFLPPSYHSIFADAIYAYDQYSMMLGTAYSLSTTSNLKFEWMRTRVGLASALVDGDVHHKSFNVFSMSYNFTF